MGRPLSVAIVCCALSGSWGLAPQAAFARQGGPAMAAAAEPLPDSARLEAAIDALFKDHDREDAPGAAVSVYRGGRQWFASGYGRADLEAGTPLTALTPIHVASVSKQFTAFAIALLAREGKVKLDVDVRTYLPWVPDLGETITVRHLILHTSGLRDQWSLFTLGGQEMQSRLRQRQIINMVSRQRALNFRPGAEYSYSNTGYTLLAEIVAAVSGQTLRQFTTDRLFRPLGMTRSFFYDDVTEIVPGRAHSYSKKKGGEGWQRELLNYDNAGATSLLTTAEDLAIWAGNFARPRVGDPALIDQITTPGSLADGSPLTYAFGLTRGKRRGQVTIEHSGSDAGFRSMFVYFPSQDLGISVLANSPLPVSEKVDAIAALLLPTPPGGDEAAALPEPIQDAGALTALQGLYLAPHDPGIRLVLENGKLGYTIRRGDFERYFPLVLRRDDSLDDGKRQGAFFKVVRGNSGIAIALQQYGARGEALRRYERQPDPTAARRWSGQDYQGDYRSEELDVTYRVGLDGSGLTVTSLWSPAPARLTEMALDRFESDQAFLGTLRFERDPTGRVSGFRVDSGRIRGVQFRRQAGD